MANPRVHQIASELGVDSKEVLRALKEMGEKVKASSSAVPPPVARKVKARLRSRSFRPSREYFPTLGSLHDDRLLALFHELPFSTRSFVRELTNETVTRETSALFSDATRKGEIFVVKREDSRLFEDPLSSFRQLAPDQLFSGTGLLVLEVGSVEDPTYRFVAWRMRGTTIEIMSNWFRLKSEQGDETLESTPPSKVRAVARNGWFSADKDDHIAILRTIFELVPIRSPDEPAVKKSETATSSQPARQISTTSHFIRLYRPGSEPVEGGSAEPNGVKKRPHFVRGHVRRQWYPSLGVRKEIWVEPYQTGEESLDSSHRKAFLVKPTSHSKKK